MTATVALTGPRIVLDHLERLTDDRGLFEHALLSVPRPEHGYCVDDAARAIVVLCREPDHSLAARRLLRCYLALVSEAIDADGQSHNRMATDRRWHDETSTGDWWGRAVWGLGVAAVHGPSAAVRAAAMTAFRRAALARSIHPHAMAFAALGAAEIVRALPSDRLARRLLADTVAVLTPAGSDAARPWPHARLSYANATLAEALIVAGDALADQAALARGLAMLTFLMTVEVRAGHLSVTPVGGREPAEIGPGFDQQPIEVSAIADACASAYRVTADEQWLTGVRLAWAWFAGDNDSGTVMCDLVTGAGYDGLEALGRNENQGAESTLALLSTAQHAASLPAAL
jgi:hypothetical protein